MLKCAPREPGDRLSRAWTWCVRAYCGVVCSDAHSPSSGQHLCGANHGRCFAGEIRADAGIKSWRRHVQLVIEVPRTIALDRGGHPIRKPPSAPSPDAEQKHDNPCDQAGHREPVARRLSGRCSGKPDCAGLRLRLRSRSRGGRSRQQLKRAQLPETLSDQDALAVVATRLLQIRVSGSTPAPTCDLLVDQFFVDFRRGLPPTRAEGVPICRLA